MNIINFPDHVLVHIISKSNNLLQSSLVCNHFNEVIASSIELMEKTNLRFIYGVTGSQIFQPSIRNYRSMSALFPKTLKEGDTLECLNDLPRNLTLLEVHCDDDINFQNIFYPFIVKKATTELKYIRQNVNSCWKV